MNRRLIKIAVASACAFLAAGSATAQQNSCRMSTEIYFESGSGKLTAGANQILEAFSRQLRACSAPLIIVVGNIDGAEAASSPRLGQTRSEAVAQVLRSQLGNAPVLTQDLAFTNPARKTGSGVREPLNRRVTVYVR